MKQVKEARIGDTFYKIKEPVKPEPGFKASKPMMYAGVYPLNPDEFNQLEKKYMMSYVVCRSWC
jgi:translation elongation factor EF-4